MIMRLFRIVLGKFGTLGAEIGFGDIFEIFKKLKKASKNSKIEAGTTREESKYLLSKKGNFSPQNITIFFQNSTIFF